MLFNSEQFLIFLPIVLIAVGLLPGVWKNRFLLVASYYFYGSWDWRFLGLIFLTTLIDYNLAHLVHRQTEPLRRKRILLISVCTNLGILGFFKYFNFFVDSAIRSLETFGIQASAPTLNIILPVGISFYTFQSMSYVIDVYRRDMQPVGKFADYALYVSYFPQLVAGPIERGSRLLPQILSPARVTPSRIHIAAILILLGLAKKVLIADSVAPEVDRIFANPDEMSAGMLLRGAYLFAFQIYGDFSGYTDIARGVSELFGIRLMINFDQPYLSRSMTEFWRRWHISLSTWLRDYLYIPLGGNRHGALQTYRNLMLTMLIGGLWHGAAWTFVIWGGLHGAMLAVERRLGIGTRDVPWSAAPVALVGSVVRVLLTFHLAVFCWIFFRAADVANAFGYVAGIAELDGLADVGTLPALMFLAVLAIDVPQYVSGRQTIFLRLPWWVRSPAYAAIAMVVLGKIFYGGRDLPFIYFQF
jgi:D-alanyl-lipoteichoic acid acyltransferase DltB (MBOAT superfamily)